MKLLHFACISVLLGLCAAGGLDAQQTRHVPAQYRTVQAAINAAVNGDTVLVAPGTYRESIDFRGKAITVLSSHGPHATILQGGTVWFRSGERFTSILDGFTVTGASPGIHCTAGPIIRNNIITQNTVASPTADGGGIHCVTPPGLTPAIILNNEITNNQVVGTVNYWYYQLRGGGVYCSNAIVMGNRIASNHVTSPSAVLWAPLTVEGGGVWCHDTLLANNVITANTASRTRAPGSGPVWIGGGVFASGNTRIVNNTIMGNTASPVTMYTVYGGGVAGSALLIANSIVWGNFADSAAEIAAKGAVTFCDVRGGYAGAGNFNLNPLLTADGTAHLTPNSPCRNAGSAAYLNFSASDHEWDNRGFGTGVDVGADEFAPHVYRIGAPKRNSTITLTVIGPPAQVVWLGLAARMLPQPINIPGSGQLWLDPASLSVLPLGPQPPTGLRRLPIPIPAHAPIGPIPFQALVGVTLTRPEIVQISP